MGLWHSIKKTVKKVGKVSVGAVKGALKFSANPLKVSKDLVKNPMGTIAKLSGLDQLFAPQQGVTATQMERQAGTQDATDMPSADRARMISRQAAQGSIPLMLLGQDYVSDDLDRDQPLGGDQR